MFKRIKDKIDNFLNNDKDYPVITALVAGIYPLLFYYSNNYPAIDSAGHLLVFSLFSIVLPLIITLLSFFLFIRISILKAYKSHLLFALLITITSSLLILAVTLIFKKKLTVTIFIIAGILSVKFYKYYKHLIIIICIMAILPFVKCMVSFYEDIRGIGWTELSDNIENIRLKHKPNIYMIQPDGYAGEEVIKSEPYNYSNFFYKWIEENGFIVYNDFRSNYPSSLTSNSSMFAMKHHYFNDVIIPSIDMPNARNVIMDNSTLHILKNNGYTSFFIAQDEYFQQDRSRSIYNYYNIKPDDVPYFTYGHDIKKNVDSDLNEAIATKTDNPKFIFIEKLLPHHVHFGEGRGHIENERHDYLNQIELANVWLKKTIKKIKIHDKNALIIVISDHGGWVGMSGAEEFYTTQKPELIRSTFGNFAAIYWNGINHEGYDVKLYSNVNVFRVLFSCLSENKSYLDHLEEDASYNIRPGNFITQSVHKLIDGNGNIVNEKH